VTEEVSLTFARNILVDYLYTMTNLKRIEKKIEIPETIKKHEK